jgi:hypothetical protein
LVARLAVPVAVLGAGISATALSLPGSAAAAFPAQLTQCWGQLAPDPGGKSAGEPNLLDYAFHCSTDISAYSLIIDRPNFDGSNVDDYSANGSVVFPTPYVVNPTLAGTISTVEGIQCGGAIPSNGINCYATNGSNGGFASAGDLIEGSIDPAEQYCKYLPKGAKPGTPAVPRAIVELIVTDNTGSQDGPFELFQTKACKKVANVVPAAKKATKPKSKKPKVRHAATRR